MGRLIGEQVEIRISDTGAGIPESVRARVFEPFLHDQRGRLQDTGVAWPSPIP